MKLLQAIAVLLFFWYAPALQAASAREQLLKGIYEQEVNNDRNASIAAYEAALKEFEPERVLAASALSRLAEVQQLRGKTNEAHLARIRLLREFSDQTNLVAAAMKADPSLKAAILGQPWIGQTAGSDAQTQAPAEENEEEKELNRIKQLIKESPDLINDFTAAPLHKAAELGQAKVVNLLLDHGADPNWVSNGSTPLRKAVIAGRRTVAELLVKRGADVNKPSNSPGQYESYLQSAANANYYSIAQFLLEKGADVNAGTGGDGTPLMFAANRKQLPMVKLLLSFGADVNAKSKNGQSALSSALKSDWIEGARIIITNKAELNVGYFNTETPLGMAVANGNLELVQLLLKAGAKPQGVTNAIPPLALALNFPDMAALLVRSGADPNVKGKDTVSLLHSASSALDTNRISLLLQLGAKVDQVDEKGYTSLHYATWNSLVSFALNDGRPDEKSLLSMRLLLANGADPNKAATNGLTALQESVGWLAFDGIEGIPRSGILRSLPPPPIINGVKSHSNYGLPIVQTLVDSHANLDTKYFQGQTLLHWAVGNNDLELVKFLIENKANLNLMDAGNLTPLDYSARIINHTKRLTSRNGVYFYTNEVVRGTIRNLPEDPRLESRPPGTARSDTRAYEIEDLLEKNGAKTSLATVWLYGSATRTFFSWPHESHLDLATLLNQLEQTFTTANLRRHGEKDLLSLQISELKSRGEIFPLKNWDELELR
ncbi:MAG: hypothetical protein JWN25_334 [Verrucomicrobiales bacterium]|nr:hypothetical protein [Verrucomicrobiales bacterium]